jgi:hypothetical protein
LFFRGDNPYVFQSRAGAGPEQHLLTWLYLKGRDHLGLLDRLRQDGDYGVCAFATGETDAGGQGRLVSRDLLDSVSELLFLDRTLGVASSRGAGVLDIGAGYGRLAHRAASAFPARPAWYCVDAVPESTFLCEYYLNRKGVDDRAGAVPLEELERVRARCFVARGRAGSVARTRSAPGERRRWSAPVGLDALAVAGRAWLSRMYIRL